jgi:hypothetical protein
MVLIRFFLPLHPSAVAGQVALLVHLVVRAVELGAQERFFTQVEQAQPIKVMRVEV